MPLSASSYEQGASPSLSIGCRKSASLSITQMICLSVDNVTIYMLMNANSALLGSTRRRINFPLVLRVALLKNLVCSCPTRRQLWVRYPVDFPHRVGTHPGHAYSRKVPEAAGFSMHNMARLSNMTTPMLGVMSSCFSGASSRHRTMSDLVPSLSFPLVDSGGGYGWFLWENVIIEVTITKLRCNKQSREKVAVTFQRWYKSTRCGPLALVWI